MKLIKEAKRFQELAGINEVKIKSSDNRKALGTVFYENPNIDSLNNVINSNTGEAEKYGYLYVWNQEFIEQLARDLGYDKYYEDAADEFTAYYEPGTKENIRFLEKVLKLKNLTVDKLTVEMYKQAMLRSLKKIDINIR
jgi:hypothetical protein